jgi:hypothetical protein
MKPLLVALAFALAAHTAAGDSNVLENGVFLVHAPADFQYTADVPQEGWCATYAAQPLTRCQDQVTRIDRREASIWFVLTAWPESKTWCGTGFGLGEYDPSIYVFVSHGPCYADQGLQLSSPKWPGPNEGTMFVTTTQPWSGSVVPVYYFIGYAYGAGTIPLSVDPRSVTAGWAVCDAGEAGQPTEYDAVALGVLGILADGTAVCPPSLPAGATAAAASIDSLRVSGDSTQTRGAAGGPPAAPEQDTRR